MESDVVKYEARKVRQTPNIKEKLEQDSVLEGNYPNISVKRGSKNEKRHARPK
jgi:hypothetical protein